MRCPKCGKDMTIGFLGPSEKGSLYWAKSDFFQSKICNLFTERNAIKNGGMHITVGNGITNNRTKAWACEDCRFVLIDCN